MENIIAGTAIIGIVGYLVLGLVILKHTDEE